jgi:hypothetical protein
METSSARASILRDARLRRAPQDDGNICLLRVRCLSKLVGRPTVFRRTPPHRVSRPVSRVLCGAGSRRRVTAIPLGRRLRGASSNLPGRPIRTSIRRIAPPRRPYSVLLPVGFAVPCPSPGTRCALTAPFHPCPSKPKPRQAVCSLWHFPWGHPRRTLSGTVCPWSPDFPPRRPFGVCAGRPSGRLTDQEWGRACATSRVTQFPPPRTPASLRHSRERRETPWRPRERGRRSSRPRRRWCSSARRPAAAPRA